MTKPLPVRTIRITDRSREVRSLPRGGLDALVQVEDVAHGWRLAASLAIAIAVPATAGSVASAQALTARASARLSGPPRTVIVILRDQNQGVAARAASQLDAVRAEQRPIIAQLRASGARDISSTSVLNTVIAKVSAREEAALEANPAVAKVIPNSLIPGPTPLTAASEAGLGGVSSKAGWRRPEDAADPGMWDRYGSCSSIRRPWRTSTPRRRNSARRRRGRDGGLPRRWR